jgi:hypothetical protein
MAKFIAIEPRHELCTVKKLAEPPGDRTQNFVTVGMTQHVNDELKSVKADDKQRNFIGIGLCCGIFFAQVGCEAVTVRKPGQIIMLGEIADARGLALADGNVSEDCTVIESVCSRPA